MNIITCQDPDAFSIPCDARRNPDRLMPTLLTHPAVPLALGLGLGTSTISRRLLLAGIALCMLPDLDVLAFRFAIPYSAELGHRGFTHSLMFAALVALLGAFSLRRYQERFAPSLLFLFITTASHGVLDALTNGGHGIAFLWPFSLERYFAPMQVIEVSPLSAPRFFSPRGATVLMSELVWVWLPCIGLFAGLAAYRTLMADGRLRQARPRRP
jgi:inner membrane protein